MYYIPHVLCFSSWGIRLFKGIRKEDAAHLCDYFIIRRLCSNVFMKRKFVLIFLLYSIVMCCFVPGCSNRAEDKKIMEQENVNATESVIKKMAEQVQKNAYSKDLNDKKGEEVVLTNDTIEKINQDKNPLFIEESVTIIGEPEATLTVPIYITGGEKIDVSGLCFDGKEQEPVGIVIESNESDINIHGNTFKNFKNNSIMVHDDTSSSGRRNISIYENTFENWGKTQGIDGAIFLNYESNPELLIDVQSNIFKTNPSYNETALVYGGKEKDFISDNTILLWSLNNVVEVDNEEPLNVSIMSQKANDEVGMILYIDDGKFIINDKDTKQITPNTTFAPWDDLIIQEGTTLEINGILELNEGVSLINNGTVLVGDEGSISYKNKSQLVGVTYP